MVRCFIGIFAPEKIKNAMAELQDGIKKLPMDCKFVEKENLHISISFLGEVSDSEVERISAELDSICKNYKKFEIVLSGIKLIPNENYIRVVAVGIENKILHEIGQLVKRRVGGDVKPPHLTLCRVRSVENKEKVSEEIKKYNTAQFGSFVAENIQLIKSELQRSGPVYTTVHKSSFFG